MDNAGLPVLFQVQRLHQARYFSVQVFLRRSLSQMDNGPGFVRAIAAA
jgi:hypothetical protein